MPANTITAADNHKKPSLMARCCQQAPQKPAINTSTQRNTTKASKPSHNTKNNQNCPFFWGGALPPEV
jgi:hypothetical protein